MRSQRQYFARVVKREYFMPMERFCLRRRGARGFALTPLRVSVLILSLTLGLLLGCGGRGGGESDSSFLRVSGPRVALPWVADSSLAESEISTIFAAPRFSWIHHSSNPLKRQLCFSRRCLICRS